MTHHRGDVLRTPTLLICGEYQASKSDFGTFLILFRGVAQFGSAHGWGP